MSIIAAALTLGAAPPPDEPAPAATIVLFGARWCAPCMAEYARIEPLADAAVPDRIVLAWIDRRIAPPPRLAGRIGALDAETARRLADGAAGEGYGLPFSVMFDTTGRACALHRAALKVSDIAKMRVTCRFAPEMSGPPRTVE